VSSSSQRRTRRCGATHWPSPHPPTNIVPRTALASIHRWADDTLNVLLADHLIPARRHLEGELEDLRTARATGTNKGKAEKRFTEVQKLLEELNDWSHLAARYFPARVRKKCHDDPSLAVAHKCFWALHPAKAYAWELRLQDEIRPDFTINEPGSDQARAAFLADHERAPEAGEIRAKELKRREKKNAKAEDDGGAGPLFDEVGEEPEASDD
jgi:hypothetical protein